MSEKDTLAPTRGARALLRQMTSEFDRMFDDWPSLRWPPFPATALREAVTWSPKVDVFEKNNHLVTRVDLPGMKKEDVG